MADEKRNTSTYAIDGTDEYYAAADDINVSASFARKLDFPLPRVFLTGFNQNIIAGLVCFCCPGMFNAMQGLGNAGGSDPAVSAAMNAALYGAFTVFGYFGGLLFNLLGNKLLMVLDGGEYWIPAALYMCMGFADSIVQTYAYWIMGAIANTPRVLARYAGYYKGVQSFGACISWILEWQGMLYKWQMVICIVWAVAFVPPTWIVATMVKDHGADDDEGVDTTESSVNIHKD
ncbi:hypothetical protein SARC_01607 [Sphaeroforma arctica JP610]|uniref:Uncharacterized protein n=1 Tax=Sphaeroforma arctica JP610 TaxID=667725 RepID=A0A0L0GB36_9EUKA|nr:hypothetical protein SARC_01607 [Sphaeroforma arctica JP610]KNC86232.1 hypothetical protein SARC_01607 [Sphaeroforma arctica JP610]|eukprot:XP_014160134.1 hypothetical protein SARC_01607 [Sphaeroforma arctica JP610]